MFNSIERTRNHTLASRTVWFSGSDAEDPPSGGRSAACLAVSPELGATTPAPSAAGDAKSVRGAGVTGM